MHKYAMSLVFLFVFGFAVAGQAQEGRQVGLTMAYPASIGLIFHPTEAIAVRPDFTFSRTSSESLGPSGPVGTSTSTGVGVGVSAIFYMRSWDHLKAYFTPRFGYSRSTANSSSNVSPVTSSSSSSGNAYAGSGSVGAQYSLNTRFGVFAETGIVFSRVSSSGSSTSTLSGGTVANSSSGHANNWSTRAGIGAILYF